MLYPAELRARGRTISERRVKTSPDIWQPGQFLGPQSKIVSQDKVSEIRIVAVPQTMEKNVLDVAAWKVDTQSIGKRVARAVFRLRVRYVAPPNFISHVP
ncbi:MAG TPA: hypothetical protein VGC86_14150 [Afipia sp.]